ncbi:HAD family hydrolase [Patulibacter sp.]|uniref:HAD family hydrolase n=1 Tax=Patulibacter sp. TaxID=1912859 RepID=UPI002724C099|nr:HAD family hydrolase [Patulibacter sp.]MDO9408785.1 HAD hydrolase-like protein [Patulibacter sp.]
MGDEPSTTRTPATRPAAIPTGLHRAFDLLESGAARALFTDVFDTVLWRRVPEPEDVFVRLGHRLRDADHLHESLAPGPFAILRRKAEHESRMLLGEAIESPEIRLHEIYDRIPEWVHPGLTRDEVVALEVALEREITVPDLDVAEALRYANAIGVPVLAVSDTYLSADQLATLLDQPGLDGVVWHAIVTSSDHRVNKAGTLFDRALEHVDADPESVVHLGDNPLADIAPAKKRGITGILLERRDPQLAAIIEQEERFAHPCPRPMTDKPASHPHPVALGDSVLAQLRAKAARHADLADVPSALQPFWRYGAQVLGPAFTGFAEWTAREAAVVGTGRLMCLMREGSFLGELVDRAARANDLPLDTRMLNLNRHLSTIAAIGSADRSDFLTLLERRSAAPLGLLLETLGIDPVRVPSLRPHLGFPSSDATARDALIRALEDPALQATVSERAAVLRARAVEAINRDAPNGPLLVCDLGWGASIQRRIVALLKQAGVERHVIGFYMVTHEGASTTVASGAEVRGFLANMGAPEAACRAIVRSPEILEQVCMPDHGSQIDLTADLEPVFAPNPLPARQTAEAGAVRAGILAFQREYHRYRGVVEGLDDLADLGEALIPQIARSVAAPTADEATRFGAWVHDENQGSSGNEALANPEAAATIRYVVPEGLSQLPMQSVYWPYGVARTADPAIADAAMLHETGEIPLGVLSTPLESGRITIAGEGVNVGDPYVGEPRRNVRGLTHVGTNVQGRHIAKLHLKLGTEPVIARIDRLELRLHLRDRDAPVVVRLEEHARSGQIELLHATTLGDGVFATHHGDATLSWATGHVTNEEIYRVDVELLLAVLPWSPPPVGDPRSPARMASSEAVRGAMEQSLSWRVTKGLRAARRG